MANYGTLAEVVAFTRYLLDGQSTFNSTTQPTATEVNKILDRSSAALNLALRKHGFSSPITTAMNSTAKLACDDWVVNRAVQFVELTHRGAGFNAEEGSRLAGFASMQKEANMFVKENELGFKYLGATVSHAASEGLTFTGLTKQKDRVDPDDTSLEQPKFRRSQWDDTRSSSFDDEDENA